MATSDTEDAALELWLGRLNGLIEQVDAWARALDWSTRLIEKKMEDSKVGAYTAPALVLQKETTRVLLEPIGRSAPGVEGVVDLYLMPGWDDIASLYYRDGRWQLHSLVPGSPPVGDVLEAEPMPLTEETFRSVLEEMTRDAA